jgi:hypothetical protein
MSAIASLETPERYLLWGVSNLMLTAAVAWVAFQIQQDEIAPAVLFPLLVGAAVGAGGLAIVRITGMPSLRWTLLGAAVWGLLVVVGQDYIGHRYRLRLYEDAVGRQSPLVAAVAVERPEIRPRFDEFLAGVVREQPLWWSLDVLLTTASTVAVTALGMTGKRFTT